MINDCLEQYRYMGIAIGNVLTGIQRYGAYNRIYSSWPVCDIKKETIAISTLEKMMDDLGESWDVNINDDQEITLQQFTNYLENKIHFIRIQFIYNIMDLLHNTITRNLTLNEN